MSKFLPFIGFLFLLASCGTTDKQQSADFINTQSELTEKLTAISKQTDFNGFAVALANDQEVLYKNGFGIANFDPLQPYTANTIQNIASVSKTLIGLAILKAQELNKLKLDDPINKYLPFKVVHPDFPEIPILIRESVSSQYQELGIDYLQQQLKNFCAISWIQRENGF